MNSLKKLMWSHLLNRCGEACPYCLIAVLETEKTKFLTIIKQQHKALGSIREYWNQDQNEDAMADALWHNINVADAALAKAAELGVSDG